MASRSHNPRSLLWASPDFTPIFRTSREPGPISATQSAGTDAWEARSTPTPPATSPCGTSAGAVNAYTASDQPMWDVSDSLNFIHGRHTIVIGANYRRWFENRELADNFLGNYTFAGYFTGNPVADSLLGYFSSAANFQPAAFS